MECSMKHNSLLRYLCAAVLAAALFSAACRPATARAGAAITPQNGQSPALFLPVVSNSNNYADKYLGLYIKLTDVDTWNSEVDQFVSMTGATHAVLLISSGYDCRDTPVRTVAELRPRLDYIHAHGATPLIAWMPSNCGNGGFGNVNTLGLPDVLSGAWDAYMTQWATDIAALGYPVFVRWGHEMNIPSYSWAGQHAFGSNGRTDADKVTEPCGLTGCYGDPNQYDGPERYIAAYRRVHDLVASIAPNIKWVWNPNGRNWPLASVAPWNDYSNYYPGDAYVDWVGVDAYNWGQLSGNGYSWTWATFDYMFRDVLADLAARYPTKPQMIPEMSCVEDAGDPNRKAQWIRDAYQSAYFNYPLLKVVAWESEVVWDGAWSPDGTPQHVTGNWADFRVNTSPQALQAYREAIRLWSSKAPLP
jgi:hypothetical protein